MSTARIEMQCLELIQLVTDYLEGTIAEVERERLESHMRECEWCERYVAQTRQVIAALGTLDEGDPDPEAWQQALTAFRERRRL